MKCPRCNLENPQQAKFCQNCGYPLPAQNVVIPKPQKKRWYQKWWIWVLLGFASTVMFIILMSVLGSSPQKGRIATSDSVVSRISETESNQNESAGKSASEHSAEEIIEKLVGEGFEEVSPSVLYNYSDKYEGKKIVTAALITESRSGNLYSEIDEGKLCFKCENSGATMNAKKGDYIIVFGIGNGSSTFGSYHEIIDCRVAAVGEQAKLEYENLLRKASNDEKKLIEEEKQKAAEEKQAYLDSCETIDYKTLSRNPDKYKGDHFKFTGEVIQVLDSDSWFDNATTLRINVTKVDSEYIDMWEDTIVCTVTIPEGQDRILEDDIITIYGDCYGLYTYTSIFGQKISIPRIDIKYYEIVTSE